MIAVFSGGNKLSNVRGFIIMQSGGGLTSFDKDSSAYFSSEKKKRCTMKLSGVSIFENTRKQL